METKGCGHQQERLYPVKSIFLIGSEFVVIVLCKKYL
jgi:hypothetical protein